MNHLPDGFYVSKNSSVHRLDETVKVLSLAVLVAAVVMTNSLYGYFKTALVFYYYIFNEPLLF